MRLTRRELLLGTSVLALASPALAARNPSCTAILPGHPPPTEISVVTAPECSPADGVNPCVPGSQGSYKIIIMDDCCHIYFASDSVLMNWNETTSPAGTERDGWIDMVMAVNDGDYGTILPVDNAVSGAAAVPPFSDGRGALCLCTVNTFITATLIDFAGVKALEPISAAITAGGAKILASNYGVLPVTAGYYPRLSVDGGVSWTDVTGLPGGQSWSGVAFSAGAAVMYIQQINGKMYKSSDGGTTWGQLAASVTPPFNVGTQEQQLRLRCSVNGSVVGLAYYDYGVPGVGYLKLSVDGGASWTSTDFAAKVGHPVYTIDFGMNSDGSVLLVSVAYDTGGPNYVGAAWTSTDYGATWVQRTLATPTLGAVTCNVAPDGLGMVIGYQYGSTSVTDTGNCDFSLDGGATWSGRSFLMVPLGAGSLTGNMVSAFILPTP